MAPSLAREPRENGREMGSKAIGVIESTPGCACPTPAPSHRHSPAYQRTSPLVTIAISGNRGSCVLSSTVQPLQVRSRQFRFTRFCRPPGWGQRRRQRGRRETHALFPRKSHHDANSPWSESGGPGGSTGSGGAYKTTDICFDFFTTRYLHTHETTTTPPLHEHLTINRHVLPG